MGFRDVLNKAKEYANDAVNDQMDMYERKLRDYTDSQILRALQNPDLSYTAKSLLEQEASRRGI